MYIRLWESEKINQRNSIIVSVDREYGIYFDKRPGRFAHDDAENFIETLNRRSQVEGDIVYFSLCPFKVLPLSKNYLWEAANL